MTAKWHIKNQVWAWVLVVFLSMGVSAPVWARASDSADASATSVKHKKHSKARSHSSHAAKTEARSDRSNRADRSSRHEKKSAHHARVAAHASKRTSKKSQKNKARKHHPAIAAVKREALRPAAQAASAASVASAAAAMTPAGRAEWAAEREELARTRPARLAQIQETRRAQMALAGVGGVQGADDDEDGGSARGAALRGDDGSVGKREGLQLSADPLGLNSSVAYVMDPQSGETLYNKNANAVLPIASITKLMSAVVLTEAKLPMDEAITITEDDVDHLKNSSSRLRVGTTLSRGQMLLLALMSSENRAAHSLARTFPGGVYNFVRYMNQKAHDLGMRSTHYVDPTGLSSDNQSSARDLATLVAFAAKDLTLRSYTTSPEYAFDTNGRQMQYHNSNALVRGGTWPIELQKTGYIREAGRCMVMQTKMAGRSVVMVLLDAAASAGRTHDAERIRQWVESGGATGVRTASAQQQGSQGAAYAQAPQGNLMRAMRGY